MTHCPHFLAFNCFVACPYGPKCDIYAYYCLLSMPRVLKTEKVIGCLKENCKDEHFVEIIRCFFKFLPRKEGT